MFKSKSIPELYTKTIIITIVMFIIILTPFTIAVVSYFQSQAVEYSKSSAQIINTTIDNYFADINLTVSNYLASREISLALRIKDGDSNKLEADQVSQIRSQISTMFMSHPGLEFIVFGLDGTVGLHSSSSIVNADFAPMNSVLFSDFYTSSNSYQTVFMHDRSYFIDNDNLYVSFIAKIPDYTNWSETIGFFVVDIRSDLFNDVLLNNLTSDFEFYIEDNKSDIIYSQNISSDEILSNKSNYVSDTSTQTGLTVHIAPLFPDWQSDFVVIIFLLVLASTGYFFIVLTWCYKQSQKIAVPIYNLENSMKDLKNNNYDAPPRYDGNIIEISSIYKSMDDLIDSLSISLEENYRKDLLLTKSTLRFLNEKIQPHFLYNTLETISNQAICDGSQSTAKMCQMLGKMFRYSMHSSDNVTLKQELDNVNNYVSLKALSAGYDNFTFNTNINEDVVALPFPKMSLQPLVENCFKHGYSHNNKNFIITLDAQKFDDKIKLIVADNGLGMSSQDLHNLRQHLADADTNYNYDYSNGGFGLTHSISQMRMFYKKYFDINITSSPNEKTEITIIFKPD